MTDVFVHPTAVVDEPVDLSEKVQVAVGLTRSHKGELAERFCQGGIQAWA